MIIAVDLGNFSVKTSEGIIFSSRFVEGDKNFSPIGEETIEFDGKFYTMEKGEFENNFNKVEKNYKPNLLYALSKSMLVTDKEVYLVLGIPVDNIKLSTKFKEELEGKSFKFKLNGKDRQIKINRVAVVAESVSSFYTLPKSERQRSVLIIDIGGRTVNVSSFVKCKVENKKTIPLGTIDFYNKLKTKLNANGKNYNIVDIDRMLDSDFIKDIEEDKDKFFKSILNDIILDFKIETYCLWFTGGGSVVLDDSIARLIDKPNFITNPIFSNVDGEKKVAQQVWSDK